MTVSIKQVAELPESEIALLVAESQQEGFRFLQRLTDEWSTGQNRFERTGEALLVARDDIRLVGVCGLNIDPYGNSPRIGRVRRLYVAADLRRHGIGRQLVERVILISRGTFNALRLRTHNPQAAQFYEALGFRPLSGVAECTHALDLNEA